MISTHQARNPSRETKDNPLCGGTDRAGRQLGVTATLLKQGKSQRTEHRHINIITTTDVSVSVTIDLVFHGLILLIYRESRSYSLIERDVEGSKRSIAKGGHTVQRQHHRRLKSAETLENPPKTHRFASC